VQVWSAAQDVAAVSEPAQPESGAESGAADAVVPDVDGEVVVLVIDTDGDLDRLRRIDAAAAELRQLVHAVMPAALCLTAFASASAMTT
jgi:hypothetical protein